MRVPLAVSLTAHVGVLAWGLVSFSSKSLEAAPSPSIPIEIVSIESFTELKRGQRQGQKKPEAVTEKRQVSNDPPREAPEAKNAKPDVQAAAAPPPPPPEAKPEPVPEPIKVSEPKPEPVKAPEPKPEIAAKAPEPKPAPKPEPKPVPKQAEAAPKPPAPKPAPKAPEPKPSDTSSAQAQPTTEKKFDPTAIAALLNKAAPPKASMTEGATAATASAGVLTGQGATLSASEIDALRAQLSKCWNPPVAASDPSALVVTVGFELNQDGSVSGSPRLIQAGAGITGQAAGESAVRAVMRCQPFKLPVEKYENWRSIEMELDPRKMLGLG